jgi:hypothetical protein
VVDQAPRQSGKPDESVLSCGVGGRTNYARFQVQFAIFVAVCHTSSARFCFDEHPFVRTRHNSQDTAHEQPSPPALSGRLVCIPIRFFDPPSRKAGRIGIEICAYLL